MATNYLQRPEGLRPNRMAILAFALMALAVVVSVSIIFAASGIFDNFQYLFLLPWVIGLGVVIAIPLAILYFQGELNYGNPIVFASFSYFIPAFVVGGFLLAAGFSEPYFLSYIQDQEYNLPLTVVLSGLGFTCLALGYVTPVATKLGKLVSRILPPADYSAESFILPGIVLLVLGIGNTVFAFAMGLFGYQITSDPTTYAGLVYLSTLFRVQGTFLLWLVILRQPKFNTVSILLMIGICVVDLVGALYAGNRGTILRIVTVVLFAFVFSGRKFGFKHGAITGVVLVV
ncbi:MAG: hypothetical protein AB7J13_09795, partial [Pyrinomonadaceae bacterium]